MKTSFTQWEADNKANVTRSKERITASKKAQVSLGEIIEKNFITSMMNFSGEQIKITRTGKTTDYMFGADFKIQYKNTGMPIDGYSVYCDITVNPNKKFVEMYRENVFTMTNGCAVSIGFKRECTQFVYRKPVLVFMIHTDFKAIEFEDSDMAAMLYASVPATKYLSDELEVVYDGKMTTGGKRASMNVIFKHKKTV